MAFAKVTLSASVHDFLEQQRKQKARLAPALSAALLGAAGRLSEQQLQGVRPELLVVDAQGTLHLETAEIDAPLSAYAAPELREGNAPPREPRVLVYALGVLGYELCAGQEARLDAQLTGPELTGPFADVIRKAVSRDRRKRFRSLEEMGLALQSVQQRPSDDQERRLLLSLTSYFAEPAAQLALGKLELVSRRTPSGSRPVAPPPKVEVPPQTPRVEGPTLQLEPARPEPEAPTPSSGAKQDEQPGQGVAKAISGGPGDVAEQHALEARFAEMAIESAADRKNLHDELQVIEARLDTLALLGPRLTSSLEEKLRAATGAGLEERFETRLAEAQAHADDRAATALALAEERMAAALAQADERTAATLAAVEDRAAATLASVETAAQRAEEAAAANATAQLAGAAGQFAALQKAADERLAAQLAQVGEAADAQLAQATARVAAQLAEVESKLDAADQLAAARLASADAKLAGAEAKLASVDARVAAELALEKQRASAAAAAFEARVGAVLEARLRAAGLESAHRPGVPAERRARDAAREVNELLADRQFVEAERVLTEALAQFPSAAVLYLRLGQLHAAQRDQAQRAPRAEAAFARAAELDPAWALPKALLGQALLRRGRRAEGSFHLRSALQLDPRCLEGQQSRGSEGSRVGLLLVGAGAVAIAALLVALLMHALFSAPALPAAAAQADAPSFKQPDPPPAQKAEAPPAQTPAPAAPKASQPAAPQPPPATQAAAPVVPAASSASAVPPPPQPAAKPTSRSSRRRRSSN